MKNYLILSLLVIGLFSCAEYEDHALEVVGSYDAVVVGYTNPFNLNISLDHRDDVVIDAIWDTFDWDLIIADVDKRSNGELDFDIPRQWVYNDTEIWGDGFYFDGYLQLEYSVKWHGQVWDYTISAERY